MHALVECRANGERHQHQADAPVPIPVVESVLIEVEPSVVGEAVHHRCRLAVDPHDVHPQPVAVEHPPGRFVMKGAERRGQERRRTAARPKTRFVKAEQCRERFMARRLRRDLLERRTALLLERLHPRRTLAR